MFRLLVAGGWPIYLLLLLSVASLSLIVERFLFLRRSRIVPAELSDQVLNEYRQTYSLSEETLGNLSSHSLLGRVLSLIVKHADSSPEKVRELLSVESMLVARQLERFLNAIGTIASIAPLMGLFGTVIGMIEIFAAHASDGSADPLHLAHGISVALYNTALGLAVAIPSLICYRYFRSVVDGFLSDMEHIAMNFFYAIRESSANR
ncbi:MULTISPECIES: MotA/TolQ/ExbB proton channel family protein [Candidatus Ichthyocystis]|uniref:Biopolymer transport protein exbB n=1 Tax=Candidatus Ichthyocystis hellenicum TaxID=1561003 RepID=A0A0S4M7E6_9BURK|nr:MULTISPECIES: MotA/TolQ/ExbB proton channel family protein [Ichthyocystis]CUT18189.1 Biopolymer transport protein exbB [Candidatus Ichthyocystis hellenicum]